MKFKDLTNASDAAQALMSYAIAQDSALAHLCSAAIQGEEWALTRVRDAFDVVASYREPDAVVTGDDLVSVAGLIETRRPDGAVARQPLEMP